MKCRRCGAENYDEAYYCRNCGIEIHNQKNKRSYDYFFAKRNGMREQNRYPQKYDATQPKDSNGHTQQKQKNYTYNKLYNRRIKTYENQIPRTYTSDINKYSNDRYNNAEKVKEYENHNNPYMFTSTLISIITIIVVLIVVLTVAFSLWYKEQDSDSLGIKAFIYDTQNIQATQEIPTLETPTISDVEIYTAELSGETHTITDFSNNLMTVEFPIPTGYVCQNYNSENYALFEREFNNGAVVTLSAVIFSSDIQKEIDYFSELQEKDGLPFESEVIDTDLGEMTVITLSGRTGGTTIYHSYVKIGDEKYFHITLSNVPEEYKTETRKLIDLIIEDTTVEFKNE